MCGGGGGGGGGGGEMTILQDRPGGLLVYHGLVNGLTKHSLSCAHSSFALSSFLSTSASRLHMRGQAQHSCQGQSQAGSGLTECSPSSRGGSLSLL